MIMSEQCDSCGALTDVEVTRCDYCGRPRRQSSSDVLDAFIWTVNGRLHAAKDESDPHVAMMLVGLLATLVLICFLGAYLGLSWLIIIVVVVIVTLGGICAMGAYIGIAENKAIDSRYANRTSHEIAAFLDLSGYRRADFDERAAMMLDEKAVLRKFLFRVERSSGTR